MSHCINILYSKSSDSYYIGETCDLEKRVKEHNYHFFDKAFTRKANDWKVVSEYLCNDKTTAKKLEAFIKRMKSRKFIQKLINDKHIYLDLIKKSRRSYSSSIYSLTMRSKSGFLSGPTR